VSWEVYISQGMNLVNTDIAPDENKQKSKVPKLSVDELFSESYSIPTIF
jgi:hypothetical protein